MIFVTGAPRSGTSMVAAVLAACGGNFGPGPFGPPTYWNPRGNFESVGMKHYVLNPLLVRLTGRRGVPGQRPLPPAVTEPDPSIDIDQLRERVTDVLDGAALMKDPKLVLLWPYFRAAFPEALWLVVRRDSGAIARSCRAAPFMRGTRAWDRWVGEYVRRIEAMPKDLEVWPDRRNIESIRPAVEFAGLEWDEEAAKCAVEVREWRS